MFQWETRIILLRLLVRIDNVKEGVDENCEEQENSFETLYYGEV